MSGKTRPEHLRIVSGQGGVSAPPERRAVAIEVEDLVLRYPIGPMVRGSLKAAVMDMFGRRGDKTRNDYVDALRGLNFSIATGERIGIIGSNGSGKSTLLRALAGVYPLDRGSITVTGQIGTLLDIGLGFEIDSTGRENIYYRGLAMGYSREDLAKAEQDIVDFADLGRFIDLPMRTYSSGMYIRLGFAVSTQFHPDVLLIDEVFAAGDAAFQEKAMQRMTRIVDTAGIVVMASHDLVLMEKLCTRCLWVRNGNIERDGPPSVVIPAFSQFMSNGVG